MGQQNELTIAVASALPLALAVLEVDAGEDAAVEAEGSGYGTVAMRSAKAGPVCRLDFWGNRWLFDCAYCRGNRTELLETPPIATTTAWLTLSPEGTWALIWYKPTKVGARPL